MWPFKCQDIIFVGFVHISWVCRSTGFSRTTAPKKWKILVFQETITDRVHFSQRLVMKATSNPRVISTFNCFFFTRETEENMFFRRLNHSIEPTVTSKIIKFYRRIIIIRIRIICILRFYFLRCLITNSSLYFTRNLWKHFSK